MVLISKQNRRKVYTHLFNEGVMCVEHAPNKPKHEEVDVPNLHAYMLLRAQLLRIWCWDDGLPDRRGDLQTQRHCVYVV